MATATRNRRNEDPLEGAPALSEEEIALLGAQMSGGVDLDMSGANSADGVVELTEAELAILEAKGGTISMSTNQFMISQIAPYPGRMYLEAMVGPILRRGVEHAIWELEHLVTEHDARLCKVYQPEDSGPLDDKRMWPFYEKA